MLGFGQINLFDHYELKRQAEQANIFFIILTPPLRLDHPWIPRGDSARYINPWDN